MLKMHFDQLNKGAMVLILWQATLGSGSILPQLLPNQRILSLRICSYKFVTSREVLFNNFEEKDRDPRILKSIVSVLTLQPDNDAKS